MPADRQIRRPKFAGAGAGANGRGPRAGVGIDPYGGPVIDPTENVLALVDAQAKFQEKMDEAHQQANDSERRWIIKHFEALMVAERRRIDDLALLKKDYDKAISETQTGQMKTTSDLVSTQLDKVTTSLSDTINKTADNIAATLATMDKRLAGVEQFRYETGGRASATDPALTQVLADITALKLGAGKSTGGDEAERSRMVFEALALQKQQVAHSGNQNMIAVMVGGFGIILALGGWIYTAMHVAPAIVYANPADIHVPGVQRQVDSIPPTQWPPLFRISEAPRW